MDNSKGHIYMRLSERMVRNDDIFCSILFDPLNRTLRVVDFRGGNFQNKHNYLERVLMAEGMRKIFTLIERDDMSGWQRVGYRREGAIPGYYKRSDAYLMSRIYDTDFAADADEGEEIVDNRGVLADAKAMAKELGDHKSSNVKVDQVTNEEAYEAICEEQARIFARTKTPQKKIKPPLPAKASGEPEENALLFPQFSREVESFFFIAQNRKSKQLNVIGAEYQDCFGNAKLDIFFSPTGKAEQTLAQGGLMQAIDLVVEIGAVSVFGLVQSDDVMLNAVYAACGFRNTGWLSRHVMRDTGTSDVVLWTRKLI